MKTQLRSLYTTVRSHIGEEYATKASDQLVKRFLRDVPLTEGMVIAGYFPARSEFNVLPLLDMLQSLGYVCALPVIKEELQPLQFRAWTNSTPMQLNAYQINEPAATAPLVSPDIILTPLLACDKKGGRLGYGKGFYDITLEALRKGVKKPLALGVCYHVQLAETLLPCDENDQKLDMIVTEKQIIQCA